jgi:hypothetical protein
MWRELFSDNPATVLAVAALLFFVAVFAAAVLWVLSGKRTAHYRRMARLPIERDGEETAS